MNVTRNVVLDLLPAYVSGEASEDSRRLVETFLERDPELGRIATSIELSGRIFTDAELAPEADVELQSLVRARKLLRRRGWLFGLALFLTLLPLTTAGIEFVLVRDVPQSGLIWIVAAALWYGYWKLRKETETTGL